MPNLGSRFEFRFSSVKEAVVIFRDILKESVKLIRAEEARPFLDAYANTVKHWAEYGSKLHSDLLINPFTGFIMSGQAPLEVFLANCLTDNVWHSFLVNGNQ